MKVTFKTWFNFAAHRGVFPSVDNKGLGVRTNKKAHKQVPVTPIDLAPTYGRYVIHIPKINFRDPEYATI